MNARRFAPGTNAKLGIAALVFGTLVLLAGEPSRDAKVSINPKELAGLIENELDHVTSEELATMIQEKKTNLHIIDLQNAEEYARYHIPDARNLSLTSLMDAGLPRDHTIVIYSPGGIHAAQAMFLLWALGYRDVYTLKGGLNAWKEKNEPSAESTKRPGSRRQGSAARPPKKLTEEQRHYEPEREKLREEC